MIRILLGLLLASLLGLGYALWMAERAGAQADKAEAAAEQLSALLDRTVEIVETERAHAVALARIAATYEQEKIDALDREARLRADLGAGNVRLRHEIGALYTAQLSQGAAHSAELAVAAERGAEAVAAAVAVGAACDARDRAWRAIAEADRKVTP